MDTIKLDYFEDVVEFASYAQGVDFSVDIQSIYPSYTVAKNKIIDVIDLNLYNEIKKIEDIAPSIKTALANYTMAEFLPFLNTKKTKEEQLYKYQVDQAREQYLTIAWHALDSVLDYLESNKNEKWLETQICTQKKALYVKDAKSFSFYYNIGNSALFFYKTLYLQREIIAESVSTKLGNTQYDNLSDIQKDKVNRFICYSVMARAVLTFDKNELPLNIRQKLKNEFSRDGNDIEREKLYRELQNKADQYASSLDTTLSSTRGGGDIVNINKEKNKFYLL